MDQIHPSMMFISVFVRPKNPSSYQHKEFHSKSDQNHILVSLHIFFSPAAKMSFPDSSDNSEKKERSVSPPIVPEDAVDIPMQCDTVNSISSISEVLAVIKDENFEKLAVILGE